MTIAGHVDEEIIDSATDWAQHEFDVCSVIRVEEISWKLWRELKRAGLEFAESDVEDVARGIVRQLIPPGGSLASKAYRDATRRYVVDAVYAGLSLPTYWEPADNLELPEPELFIFSQAGKIWIECETLTGTGAVSVLVSLLYHQIRIAKRYAAFYDKFVFVVPKASGYKRGILEHLIRQEVGEESAISILSL